MYITDSDIIPGYRADHSSITLRVKLQNNERGRGYWKFNNSLLKDKSYVDEIKKIIQEVKNTYAINENIPINNDIPNQDLRFNINDQLFLETLLMIIRGETIKYSSLKTRKVWKKKKNLKMI